MFYILITPVIKTLKLKYFNIPDSIIFSILNRVKNNKIKYVWKWEESEKKNYFVLVRFYKSFFFVILFFLTNVSEICDNVIQWCMKHEEYVLIWGVFLTCFSSEIWELPGMAPKYKNRSRLKMRCWNKWQGLCRMLSFKDSWFYNFGLILS